MRLQTLESRLLQEQVVRAELPEGLGVFVLPKPGYQKKYAVFATRYGSVDNHFVPPGEENPVQVPDGIAHFLEHKLFEEEGGHTFDRFARLGASANAYTSYTMTSYLFSCTEHFRESFDVLLNFVQEPYFTPENVEKEKGIIEQEIRMYDDHPRHRVLTNLLRALYREHPVRIDIAGSVESIRRIDTDRLHLCHRTFYHPSNMAVFVVGDVEPRAVIDQVAADLAARGYRRRDPVRRLFPAEPPEVAEARHEDELAVSRPYYALGFKDPAPPSAGAELLRQDVVTSLLWTVLLGRSSELYNRLYEEQLVDDGFGARYVLSPLFGHSVVGGETRDPDALHGRILEGIEEARRAGIPAEDVRRLQRQAIGEFLQLFNSLEFIANSYLYYHFMGADLFQYLEVLEEISPAAVAARLEEHLDPARAAASVVRPRKG